MQIDVAGKRVLVTGASSGLGAAFAGMFALNGARVALAARRIWLLENLASELRSHGAEVMTLALDVSEDMSIRSTFEQIQEEWGGLDVLVNNAGATRTKAAIDYEAADYDDIMGVNLRGAFMVAKEAAVVMRANGGGSIINIASILGERQAGMVASYAISKAGVIQMTKTLALEWARFGIRVNALAPGYIETDLNEDFWQTDAGKAMIRRIPQRRLGRVHELEAPLMLLASDQASYMTGSVLAVDGGHLVSTL